MTTMITVTTITMRTIIMHDHAHAHHHHEHDHVHDEHCGHSHGPTPSELAGPGGWGRGFAAILTVGIRPCSGAILVLVFALAQGLFWAGIAATLLMGLGTAITVAAIAVVAVSAKDIAARLSAGRDGGGALFMRGIEFAAAGLVLLFGAGLLFGYIAAERTTCFDAAFSLAAGQCAQAPIARSIRERTSTGRRFNAGMKKIPRLIAKPMLHRIERSVGRLPR